VNRGLLWSLLIAVLTLGWVGTAPQASAATSSCNGVWVVVDYGSLGGTSTKCATSYSTGRAALTSAGFDPTLDNGMITKISGKPGNPDPNKNYWSYWTATLKSDGSYSGWSYSNLGATSSHPAKGNAEGWRYQPLSAGKVAPGVTPPKGEGTPKPTPTPTPTRTTTKPTASAKPTATATSTATKKPTATASATSPRPTVSASTAPTSASPTAGQTPGQTPAQSTTGPLDTPTPLSDDATQEANNSEPSGKGGSPVGAIAVGSIVLAGSAGVGGWWLLKGRRR